MPSRKMVQILKLYYKTLAPTKSEGVAFIILSHFHNMYTSGFCLYISLCDQCLFKILIDLSGFFFPQ